MLKIFGFVMVMLGSFGFSLLSVKRLSERITALQSMLEALNYLECELDFSMDAMPQILFNTASRASGSVAAFFEFCGRELRDNAEREFSHIWRQAVEERMNALHHSDIVELLALGHVLGRFDAEHQKKSIAVVCNNLQKCLDSAKEEKSRQGKVYGVVGVAVGFCLTIILL